MATSEQLQQLLSDFGKIPEHQVKYIWNLAHDFGYKKGREDGYRNGLEYSQKEKEVQKKCPVNAPRTTG